MSDYNADHKVVVGYSGEFDNGEFQQRLDEAADHGNRKIVGVTTLDNAVVVIFEPVR